MVLRPLGHPLELAGPLVSLQSSNSLEVTHETPSGFSSLLVVRACMLAVPMVSITLKGPTNLRCSFAGVPFIFKFRVDSSTKSPTL